MSPRAVPTMRGTAGQDTSLLPVAVPSACGASVLRAPDAPGAATYVELAFRYARVTLLRSFDRAERRQLGAA